MINTGYLRRIGSWKMNASAAVGRPSPSELGQIAFRRTIPPTSKSQNHSRARDDPRPIARLGEECESLPNEPGLAEENW